MSKPFVVPLISLGPNTALILGAALSGGDAMALARRLADTQNLQPNKETRR